MCADTTRCLAPASKRHTDCPPDDRMSANAPRQWVPRQSRRPRHRALEYGARLKDESGGYEVRAQWSGGDGARRRGWRLGLAGVAATASLLIVGAVAAYAMPTDAVPTVSDTTAPAQSSPDLGQLDHAATEAKQRLDAEAGESGSPSDRFDRLPNPLLSAPMPPRQSNDSDDERFDPERLKANAAASRDEMPPANPQPDVTSLRLAIPAHSCCLGAPFPLNFQSMVGYYWGPDGSYNQVVCLAEVASDTPYARNLNYRYITYTAG
jgi:hypothetical protein